MFFDKMKMLSSPLQSLLLFVYCIRLSNCFTLNLDKFSVCLFFRLKCRKKNKQVVDC